MNTTMLFVELLIIGLEGGIWLLFLVLSILGTNGVPKAYATIKEAQALTIAITLPILYVIGILLDRCADRLFKAKEKEIERDIVGKSSVTVPVMRFSLGTENDFLNQQLEYTRTRMRIVRASSLNFVLIALNSSIFILTRITSVSISIRWGYVALIVFVGLMFAFASFSTWKSLASGHVKLTKAMYEYSNPPRKKRKQKD